MHEPKNSSLRSKVYWKVYWPQLDDLHQTIDPIETMNFFRPQPNNCETRDLLSMREHNWWFTMWYYLKFAKRHTNKQPNSWSIHCISSSSGLCALKHSEREWETADAHYEIYFLEVSANKLLHRANYEMLVYLYQ